jgi:signal transduction histidine kinase
MMFASQHDLLLATGLLVFATGIAVIVGLFLSATITSRIQQLSAAAIMVAKGDLDTRLVVVGRDEMAMLARSFNDMVLQLELAEQKKAGAERLRRDLIAWVGHDLRTPLTSIRAIIEALSDGLIEDEETRLRYLKTAQANIKSLSNLIDDLFEMSQIDAGGFRLELEMGNISDLVSDIYELFAEQARMKGVQLEAYISPDVGLVLMDEKRIGRVLANLISNAIRHTPAGGAVQTNIFKSDSELHAIVKDNGEGIQPGDLPNIFDRFYRGEKSRNRSTGGSGLGLAIARSIVEAHGGSITADSEPGKGTIIRFILPAN